MKIFISYRRVDEEFARKLAASLVEAQHEVWIDVEDITPGHIWSDDIQQGLDLCEILLLIVTPPAMDSTNVGDEWRYYHSNSKPIIPLILVKADLPYQLNALEYIDFQNQPYDAALARLLGALAAGVIPTPPPVDRAVPPSHDQKVVLPSVNTTIRPSSAKQPTRTILTGLFFGVVAMLVVSMLSLISWDGDEPKMTCVGSNSPDAPLIIVADFAKLVTKETFLLERLYENLTQRLGDQARICRLNQVIDKRPLAQDVASAKGAALVVWGRIDNAGLEYNIEVTRAEVEDESIPRATLTALSNLTVQVQDLNEVGFVVEFTISQLYEVDGRTEEARQLLKQALDDARPDWPTSELETLIDPYFVLADLSSIDSENRPLLREAVEYYSTALELDADQNHPDRDIIQLNRAVTYLQLGQDELALADLAYLIETDSSVKGMACTNRAVMQTERAAAEADFECGLESDAFTTYVVRGGARLYDWNDPAGAVDDFRAAIEDTPDEGFVYHFLALAQLKTGDFAGAVSTYQAGIGYMTPDFFPAYVAHLEELEVESPEMQTAIDEILGLLQPSPTPMSTFLFGATPHFTHQYVDISLFWFGIRAFGAVDAFGDAS
ncbi:MAG: TIR domain-containing protein [Anaerolineae bacterium]|nr:TIR domain-containing protein [Anaerolineae bacterium]